MIDLIQTNLNRYLFIINNRINCPNQKQSGHTVYTTYGYRQNATENVNNWCTNLRKEKNNTKYSYVISNIKRKPLIFKELKTKD